jgi:hypothetical protein
MLITLIKWIVTPWFMSKKEIVYKQTLIVCYKPIIFSTHNYEKKTFCIAKIYFLKKILFQYMFCLEIKFGPNNTNI